MSEQDNPNQNDQPENIPLDTKSYIIKCQNLEKTIKDLKQIIIKLSKQILEVNKEKEELKIIIHSNSVVAEELANLKEEIKNVRYQRDEIVQKKDKEISNLNRKISQLESKIQMDRSDFDKTSEIYSSKINTISYLQMDNEVYRKEIQNLLKGQEEFKAKVEQELKMERNKYSYKMDKFKEKMMDSLKKSNEDLKKFNYEFMGINNRLLVEEKRKLFMIIEEKNEIIKDLNKQIDMLKEKLNENEKDQEIHKLVEYNLAYKLILKGQNLGNKKPRKRNMINNTQIGFPNLKKNQSEKDFYKQSLYKDSPKTKYANNNINLAKSNSIEELEQYPKTQKSNFIFGKQRANYLKEIQEKNFELEKEQLINIQLRNKLNIYKNKFKGLVEFLEENLKYFSKDEKLMAKTNFNTKSEKLRKCEFNDFNIEEKKELLLTLIKYLMPLANPDMDINAYNESNTYFNTNLSITRLKKVNNKIYLKDNILKKAFVNKANRYHKDVLTGKNLIFASSKNDLVDI